jgi:hypothetical protein
MTYQTRQILDQIATYALVAGIIVLMAAGIATLTNRANVKIESRCIAQGGQVLVTPGEVSRCLLPTAR